MRNYYILLLSCLIIGLSCSKSHENSTSPYRNPIVFNKMKVGQKSQYVLLRGEDYKNTHNFNFEYLADTMIVEIVRQDEHGFLVEEYLSAGSISLHGEYHVAHPESTFSYYFKIANEYLSIIPINEREVSRVFFLSDSSLPLAKNTDLKVAIQGWKTSLPYKEDEIMAYTEQYELFDEMYSFLNVLIDNKKMKQRQPGYTHVYAPEFGLVRSSQYSPETSKGFGWDLLK